MDLSDSALQKIGTILDTKITAAVAPLTAKVQEVEKRIDAQDGRLGLLEAKMNKIDEGGQGKGPGRFVPSHIEIKGFCDFSERKTKGISRVHAEELLSKLVPTLPPTLQSKVGELELYGSRSHKFKVNIKPPGAIEIALLFKEKLQSGDDGFLFNGKELFATAQREPEVQNRFARAGRARAFLEMKAQAMDPTTSAKCFWQPNFQLSTLGSILGVVGADGEIEWNPEAVQSTLGMTVEAIKQELVEFKQR